MNKQRETIYRKRREVLESTTLHTLSDNTVVSAGQGEEDNNILAPEEGKSEKTSLHEQVLGLIAQEIGRVVDFHTQEAYKDGWNYEEIFENLNTIFPLPAQARQNMKDAKDKEGLIDYLTGLAKTAYAEKEKQVGEQQMRQIEKLVYLRTMDMLWMDHLDEMEHLRDSVKLRAYGQKDPLVEYKNEGHKLFQRLLGVIQSNFVGIIYRVSLEPQQPVIQHQPMFTNKQPAPTNSSIKQNKNIGRNDPCWCGSGKKFKKCGMLNTAEHQQNMLKNSGAKYQQRIGG